jgi:hypothetical protein
MRTPAAMTHQNCHLSHMMSVLSYASLAAMTHIVLCSNACTIPLQMIQHLKLLYPPISLEMKMMRHHTMLAASTTILAAQLILVWYKMLVVEVHYLLSLCSLILNPHSTPHQQPLIFCMICEALAMPDADEWKVAMDIEIENLCHLCVFRTVPCPIDKNVITPKWVFHQKFENGALVKHKAHLVTHGFTQLPGIDYNKAHLYAPVMRLESFRMLISVATLFNHNLCQFNVLATYLHGDIDGEVYMDPPPGYGDGESTWLLLKGLYRLRSRLGGSGMSSSRLTWRD